MMNEDLQLLISRLDMLPEWHALEQHLEAKRGTLIRQLIHGDLSWDAYLRVSSEIRGLETILIAPSTPTPKRPVSVTGRH
jgi:hypothetical protein